jgi:hypothetical protein
MAVRVLQICPFDIPQEPRAGGQIRIEAIAQAYLAAGCEVVRSCVVTRQRDVRRPADLVLPWIDRIRRKHVGKPGHLGQIRQHWASSRSRALQHQLAAHLEGSYQIVHVEHPWNVALMHAMRHHPSLSSARLVYSAHNIESALFKSVVTEQGHWNRAARSLQQEIFEIEMRAAACADLVWAVSEHDAHQLENAANRVLVVPNGCRALPQQPTPSPFGAIKGRYALFVGTDYGPNVNGFLRMLGDDFTHLPAGCSVQTIGSCADVLKTHPAHARWLAEGRLVHHGRVDADTLDAALLQAGLVLLPILAGGVTNLKTAEALVSARPVLGTSHAFRGFEDWRSSPEVHVQDQPAAFRTLMAELLARPTDFAIQTDVLRHQSLLWPNILRPAVQQTLQA